MEPIRKTTSPSMRVATKKILDKVENLPTLPMVALKVGEMVHDPGVSARDVAQALESDPSLTAKVLRLVNSSYYGIPGGVSDVQRAISFVGFTTLHQLVLSVSVLDTLKTPKGQFDARGLWLHSLAVGCCSAIVAKQIGYEDPEACFTAGLLHDIGKIALAKAAPEEFGSAVDLARETGCNMSIAEKSCGLPSHDRVGSKLAKKWKFPAELLMPIEYHHSCEDPQFRNRVPQRLRSVVDIVSLADDLSRHFKLGESGSPAPEQHNQQALDRLGYSTISVDRIYTPLMRKLESSKAFLDLLGSK